MAGVALIGGNNLNLSLKEWNNSANVVAYIGMGGLQIAAPDVYSAVLHSDR